MVLKVALLFATSIAHRPSYWILQLAFMIVAIYLPSHNASLLITSSFIGMTILFSSSGLSFKHQNHIERFLFVFNLTKHFTKIKYIIMCFTMSTYLILGYFVTGRKLFLLMLLPALVFYIINFLVNDFRVQKYM